MYNTISKLNSMKGVVTASTSPSVDPELTWPEDISISQDDILRRARSSSFSSYDDIASAIEEDLEVIAANSEKTADWIAMLSFLSDDGIITEQDALALGYPSYGDLINEIRTCKIPYQGVSYRVHPIPATIDDQSGYVISLIDSYDNSIVLSDVSASIDGTTLPNHQAISYLPTDAIIESLTTTMQEQVILQEALNIVKSDSLSVSDLYARCSATIGELTPTAREGLTNLMNACSDKRHLISAIGKALSVDNVSDYEGAAYDFQDPENFKVLTATEIISVSDIVTGIVNVAGLVLSLIPYTRIFGILLTAGGFLFSEAKQVMQQASTSFLNTGATSNCYARPLRQEKIILNKSNLHDADVNLISSLLSHKKIFVIRRPSCKIIVWAEDKDYESPLVFRLNIEVWVCLDYGYNSNHQYIGDTNAPLPTPYLEYEVDGQTYKYPALVPIRVPNEVTGINVEVGLVFRNPRLYQGVRGDVLNNYNSVNWKLCEEQPYKLDIAFIGNEECRQHLVIVNTLIAFWSLSPYHYRDDMWDESCKDKEFWIFGMTGQREYKTTSPVYYSDIQDYRIDQDSINRLQSSDTTELSFSNAGDLEGCSYYPYIQKLFYQFHPKDDWQTVDALFDSWLSADQIFVPKKFWKLHSAHPYAERWTIFSYLPVSFNSGLLDNVLLSSPNKYAVIPFQNVYLDLPLGIDYLLSPPKLTKAALRKIIWVTAGVAIATTAAVVIAHRAMRKRNYVKAMRYHDKFTDAQAAVRSNPTPSNIRKLERMSRKCAKYSSALMALGIVSPFSVRANQTRMVSSQTSMIASKISESALLPDDIKKVTDLSMGPLIKANNNQYDMNQEVLNTISDLPDIMAEMKQETAFITNKIGDVSAIKATVDDIATSTDAIDAISASSTSTAALLATINASVSDATKGVDSVKEEVLRSGAGVATTLAGIITDISNVNQRIDQVNSKFNEFCTK